MLSWIVQFKPKVKHRPRSWPWQGAATLLIGWLMPLAPTWGQTVSARPVATTACPPLLQHRIARLQDEKPQDLCQYAGRVVLVVNTASQCGFTGQYAGLEALHARLRDRGLVVLGFPSNDFGRQEPGSHRQIADFCENTFGVRFPMFVKTTVVGRDAHPLYRQLAQRSGEAPRWNFHKYLIGRDGQTVRSHPSAVEPEDPAFLRDIESLLLVEK